MLSQHLHLNRFIPSDLPPRAAASPLLPAIFIWIIYRSGSAPCATASLLLLLLLLLTLI